MLTDISKLCVAPGTPNVDPHPTSPFLPPGSQYLVSASVAVA